MTVENSGGTMHMVSAGVARPASLACRGDHGVPGSVLGPQKLPDPLTPSLPLLDQGPNI